MASGKKWKENIGIHMLFPLPTKLNIFPSSYCFRILDSKRDSGDKQSSTTRSQGDTSILLIKVWCKLLVLTPCDTVYSWVNLPMWEMQCTPGI